MQAFFIANNVKRLFELEEELDIEKFKNLAKNSNYNVKQIAKLLGYDPKIFGAAIKNLIGEYPSVYIHKVRNGKTSNSIPKP